MEDIGIVDHRQLEAGLRGAIAEVVLLAVAAGEVLLVEVADPLEDRRV